MKYELTKQTMELASGKKLYRIRALRDIQQLSYVVKKGELGGFIESPANLDQNGNAWVGGDAMVIDNALVTGNASVGGFSNVSGNSRIGEEADIGHSAFVVNSEISGKCIIREKASLKDCQLSGDVICTDKAELFYTTVSGAVQLRENILLNRVKIKGDGIVIGGKANLDSVNIGSNESYLKAEAVVVREHSRIQHCGIHGRNILIEGHAVVTGGATMMGEDIRIAGHAEVIGDVVIGDKVTINELATIHHLGKNPLELEDTLLNGDFRLG